jgi:hypothetical protein
MVCAYRGAPNDAVVFACILEAARSIAFWKCLHKIRGIREIRGSFLLLKDISMTTGLNTYKICSLVHCGARALWLVNFSRLLL